MRSLQGPYKVLISPSHTAPHDEMEFARGRVHLCVLWFLPFLGVCLCVHFVVAVVVFNLCDYSSRVYVSCV